MLSFPKNSAWADIGLERYYKIDTSINDMTPSQGDGVNATHFTLLWKLFLSYQIARLLLFHNIEYSQYELLFEEFFSTAISTTKLLWIWTQRTLFCLKKPWNLTIGRWNDYKSGWNDCFNGWICSPDFPF